MKRLSLVILWQIIFVSLYSQPFNFKHLEVADGLSNNSVYAILKDKDGFMWFGTNAGLNRFDGYTFKVFRHLHDDKHSLPDNYVKEIIESPNGNLWIKMGTGYTMFDKAANQFNNDTKSFMKKLGSNGLPECIYVDSNEQTWFFVGWEGFYRYDKNNNTKFVSLYNFGLPEFGVSAINECNDGILFQYNNGILVCIDPSEMKPKWIKDEISLQMNGKQAFYSLFVDKEQCIWISNNSNLYVYDTVSDEWRHDLEEPWKSQNDIIHSVSQDNIGRIWVGKDYGGIDVFDKKTGHLTNLVNDKNNTRSLSHNTVYKIYTDKYGTTWIGTYKKGISYYSESMFKFNMYEIGDITCVEQADDKHVWLGTNNDGLLLWNIEEAKVKKHYNFTSPIVSLLKTSDNRLWIGTFNNGLYSLDIKGLTKYTVNNNGLLGNNVWSMAEANGKLWIGFLDGGIQYIDMKSNKLTKYDEINGMVPSLCVTKDNILVVGKSQLALVDLGTLKLKETIRNTSLSGHGVSQVYSDSRGLIWIATNEGLEMYNRKRHATTNFTETTNAEGEVISGITEDNNHDIWVTSTRHMIHIKVSKDANGEYVFESHIYNEKDGLQNCDFNLRAIKTLKDGTIIAGGLYGLNTFNPDKIHYNTIPPKIMFSELYLFNQKIEAGVEYNGNIILTKDINSTRKVELKNTQNIFSLELSSDNYNLPEKTCYKYKMEGVNDEWLTLPVGLNRLTFTNLTPKKYILNVKAINSDGYESIETAKLEIVVHPPFWLSWWAYSCYTLIAICILLSARKMILKREREKFRLQQIEQEAVKNEEINQMKFRFFTNISHELRTPLTLIISPLEDLLKSTKDESQKSMLMLIYRNAQRLLILVNQLLDFRKSEMTGHTLSLSESDIVAYIREVCNSFLLMANKKHIQFFFFSGIDNFHMAFDADKISKIVTNLLSNAFKFTPDGGRVTVMIEHIEGTQEMLEIKVSDTGIGIPDSEKEHIFERFYQAGHKGIEESTGSGIGLSLVRDFVNLHDGSVEVFDNIGTGTVFVIQLPVKHVDLISEHIVSAVENTNEKNNEDTEKVIEQTDRKDFPLILIVDDNEDFRIFMQHSLELQYNVEIASNGEEAWEMIQQKRPDLIISDVMMPVMDGIELCKLIKNNQPTAHIPVILLTARQAVESKVEGLEIGADDYVTKPFNMTVLTLRIRKLIELSHYKQISHSTIDPTPSNIVITSLDEKLVEKAIKYVEDNISRSELSVEELSSELGMSRVHLYKKLLQITGKTPIEFIRTIRLKRAAQLLRESQLYVSEIAYEVGFNNPKYFSKYFKDEFGVLPSAYQLKEKNNK